MRSSLAALLALAVLLSAASGHGATVAASAQGPAIPPLDVVVVIDQSGSMSGRGGVPASDPESLRITAVAELASLLGAYGQTSDVRFAVVDFGSTSAAAPILTVPLTQMSPATAANNVIPRLKSTDLGSTEFRSPLCLAWQVVSGVPLPPGVQCEIPPSELVKVALAAPSRDRRKVVVLITDGAPARGFQEYAFSRSDPQDCSVFAGSEGHQYMCGLDAMWTRLTQVQPVELNVIGLDVNNQWWPTVERYWRLIARCDGPCAQTRVTQDPRAIEKIVTDQIDNTARSFANICPVTPNGPARANTCSIEPGLLEARFSISTSGGEIRVTTPKGAPPPADTLNRLQLSKKEVWIVQFPEPGDWRVESTDPNAVLAVEVLKTAESLAFETFPVKPIAGEDFEVRAKVQNRDGRGAVSIPEQASSFDVTLTVSKDGKELDKRTLKSVADRSQDEYKFTPPLRLDAPGDYQLSGSLRVGANTFAAGTAAVTIVAPPPPLLRVESMDASPKTVKRHWTPCCPMDISEPGTLRLRVTLGNPDIQVDPYRLARWLKLDGPPLKGAIKLSLEDCSHNQAHCDLLPEFSFPAGVGQTEVDVRLPADWRESGKIRTEASVDVHYLDGAPAHLVSDANDIAVERPQIDESWQRYRAGIAVPILLAVLALIAVSFFDVQLSRPLNPDVPYRDLAAWRRSSAAQYEEIVSSRGFMVWRSFPAQGEAKKALLARGFLIAGPLTLRGGVPDEPPAPTVTRQAADEPPTALDSLKQRLAPMLRKFWAYAFGQRPLVNDGSRMEFPLGDPAARNTDRIVVGPSPEIKGRR